MLLSQFCFTRASARLLACVFVVGSAPLARSQTVPPNYGFDFVTIGAPGNTPYVGPATYGQLVVGRGRVDYLYRISATEVSTIQWMTFLNTFAGTGTPPPHFDPYAWAHWGAQPDPAYTGPGVQYRLRNVPDAERLPVSGISYHMGMLFCNWLHNGKQLDPSSLISGAYDTTLVPLNPPPPGPNQLLFPTHLPGAKYWVPTLDEWVKAANYDPNRYGPGREGWWSYRNSSDQPGISGPPGIGTTSAGWEDPLVSFGEWDIPLGAYPDSRSPWGLLDTSGGTDEWTEEISNPSLPHQTERYLFRPGAGNFGPLQFVEWIGAAYSGVAFAREGGLRIASAVPGPTASLVLVLAGALCGARHRDDHRAMGRR